MSRGAVTKLAKHGTPTSSREAAEAWRREHLDPALSKQTASPAAASGSADRHRDERTAWVAAKRRIAELELAEREGRLIDANKARDDAWRAGAIIRDSVLALPARLAADLAAMDDAGDIERFLAGIFFRAELTRLAVIGEGNGAA